MKQLSVILFIFCFVQVINAQNFSHEFGKSTIDELKLEKYEKDTSAEAVMIYNIGKSYFVEGYLYFDIGWKIKILTKGGLEWAQTSISYYEDGYRSESIEEIKGFTYNLENGEVRSTPLELKNAYIEKDGEHWKNKKFAMPDVKVGSVIEIFCTIKSPFLYYLHPWEFQKRMPVIYSEYTAKMIPHYEYISILQGAKKYDEYTSYIEKERTHQFAGDEFHDMVYCYVMKDLPAFKDETFITSKDDYIVRINFQLDKYIDFNGIKRDDVTTWPELIKGLLNHEKFGEFLSQGRRKSKAILDTMNFASKPLIERARIIDHFVKANYSWNGNCFRYTSNSLNDFLKSKKGNSAEINLFLVAMLNTAGIEAYPVILSTRGNGKISLKYPFEDLFNNVAVFAKIDSSSFLLDATEPLANFNEIPSRCLNGYGLIIKKNEENWVQFQSNSVSTTEYYFELKPNTSNDSINESFKLITTGYEAIDYRNKFNTSYNKLKEKLLPNSNSGDSIKPINLNKVEEPFEIDFSTKVAVESIEDKIIVTPFCNKAITENPLKQPTRTYPIDMVYKKANIFHSNIFMGYPPKKF